VSVETLNPPSESHRERRRTRLVFVVTSMFMLAACGGSGGKDVDQPAPPAAVNGPTIADLENAQASQLSVLLNADSSELTVTWIDAFPDESGYAVERRAESGAWEVLESLPAAPATGTAYTWQRVVDRSATYRVVARRTTYVVPLKVNAGISEVPVDLMARSIALLIDQQDPVNGTAQVSIEGAASARSVRYFADLSLLATSTAGPSFLASWNTRPLVDGDHLLMAHVELAEGLLIEVRRSVTLDNPNVAVALDTSGTSGVVALRATASSDVGVQSVEFFLNGASLGLLEAPNSNGSWVWSLDTRGLPAGTASIQVVARDNAGDQAEASRQIFIDNGPVVALETPINGAIVSGSLEVRGTLADDQPGPTLTAYLGDAQVFQSTQSQFATTYSLAGLPGGQYTLTVRASDSAGQTVTVQRAVIVSSSVGFNYELIGSSGAGTSLLDTEAGKLLYQIPDKTVRLRSANGSEVDMAGSASIAPLPFVDARVGGSWDLDGDYVTAAGKVDGTPKVFLYDASGSRTEMTAANGVNDFLRSALHGPWLVWGAEWISVRNLLTQFSIEPIPARLLHGHAFVTATGAEQLFFSRDTGQQGTSATIDIFRYSLVDQTIMQLSSGDGRHLRPRTDGLRVAWERAEHNQNIHAPPFDLIVAPVDNPGSATVRSSSMMSFDLKDGLLAWVEHDANALALKVDDGAQTETLSLTTATTLYSTANSHVIYGENGKLYTWDRAHGRRLLLDVLPKQILHRDGVVFFTTGAPDVAIHQTQL
jgi:Bacterial Ig domain